MQNRTRLPSTFANILADRSATHGCESQVEAAFEGIERNICAMLHAFFISLSSVALCSVLLVCALL